METLTGIPAVAVVYVVLLCVLLQQGLSILRFTSFTSEVACKLQERVNLGSAELKNSKRSSLVRCAAACMDQCYGVSVDKNNECYHHLQRAEKIFCSSSDVHFQLYHKSHCEHDGVWDPARSTCKCVSGWIGDRCERYPRNCGELFKFRYEDGEHKLTYIRPEHSQSPFFVYCSYVRGNRGTLTYIFRNNGNYDNTLTWDDYVSGFYHDDKNYWIGLKNIKSLNDDGHRFVHLRADVDPGPHPKAHPSQNTFIDFRLGSASTGYNFTAIIPGGHYCLTPVQGVAFSTADHDNDQDSSNCAKKGKAGWWFKTCDVGCNPLGPKFYRTFIGMNKEWGDITIEMVFEV